MVKTILKGTQGIFPSTPSLYLFPTPPSNLFIFIVSCLSSHCIFCNHKLIRVYLSPPFPLSSLPLYFAFVTYWVLATFLCQYTEIFLIRLCCLDSVPLTKRSTVHSTSVSLPDTCFQPYANVILYLDQSFHGSDFRSGITG